MDIIQESKLYLPFYDWSLKDSVITSKDPNHHVVTKTGTTWGLKGASFNGDGDMMAIPNPTILNFERTDKFAITWWMNSLDISVSREIMSKVSGGPSYRGWFLRSNPYDGINFQFINDFATNKISINFEHGGSLTGTWEMFTLVYDGSSDVTGVNMYRRSPLKAVKDLWGWNETVNGQTYEPLHQMYKSVDANSLTGSTQSEGDFRVGAFASNNFKGTLGEITILEELTVTDIDNIYEVTNWRYA